MVRNIWIRLLCWAFALGGNLLTLSAQNQLHRPIRFTQDNGLPYNYVNCLRKGPDGFMWVGTSDGLSRFDGIRFTNYSRRELDSTSLFDNFILAVLPMEREVWVGTSQGISILDIYRGTFQNFQFANGHLTRAAERQASQDVSSLHRDKQGNIWIGTRYQGLAVMRPGKGDVDFLDTDQYIGGSRELMEVGNPTILSFSESATNDSILFAGTTFGLYEVNKQTGRLKHRYFEFQNKDWEGVVNSLRRIHHHGNGLLYMGGWYSGVHIYEPNSGKISPLPLRDTTYSYVTHAGIRAIVPRSRNEIWISTGMGLVLYNTDEERITYCRLNDPRNGIYFGVHQIDEKQRVWSGEINGLHLFDPIIQQFEEYSFASLSPQAFNYVFYMSEWKTGREAVVFPQNIDAAYHFDMLSQRWTKVPFPFVQDYRKAELLIRGMAEAPDGSITLSSNYGLFQYLPARKQFRKHAFQPPVRQMRYGRILWDRRGRLWITANLEGIFRWDPKTGEVRKYKEALEKTTSGIQTVTSFGKIMEDSRGNIWIRRNDGYSVYMADKDSMINHLATRDNKGTFAWVNDFAEDKKGRMWLASSEGVIGYAFVGQPEKGIIARFNLFDRYDIREVWSMVADSSGHLWGVSRKEFIHIDPESLKITPYAYQYGIPDTEFFEMKALASNRIMLGGRNKIFLLDPRQFRPNEELPKPYIAEVQIQQKPQRGIIMGDVDTTLQLRYWQNNFGFSFSAQGFTLGNQTRFRYRLLGFDNWTDAGDRLFANYTNVPGGDYVFELQAANSEGIWNREVLRLPVHVATPWWLKTWFIASLVLAGLGILYLLYRYRISMIKKEERMKASYEKKLATTEMSALLAQMNPHFLFNSLNSIDSYILRNETRKASEYLNNFARLIRMILHHSRSNYITLKDELETLDLYLQMESLRFKDKFDYEIIVDPDIDTAHLEIPPMLMQPFVENAIWHGLMHKDSVDVGKVSIRVGLQGDNLVCVIEDNGIGREKAAEIKSKKSRPKKSMGMQITRDRIEMINKLYNANTQVRVLDLHDAYGEAAGTRVELTIPI